MRALVRAAATPPRAAALACACGRPVDCACVRCPAAWSLYWAPLLLLSAVPPTVVARAARPWPRYTRNEGALLRFEPRGRGWLVWHACLQGYIVRMKVQGGIWDVRAHLPGAPSLLPRPLLRGGRRLPG